MPPFYTNNSVHVNVLRNGTRKILNLKKIRKKREIIVMPSVNAVTLMKGNLWPGIETSMNGMGLCHKAPTMKVDAASGNPLEKRFMLKVDVM